MHRLSQRNYLKPSIHMKPSDKIFKQVEVPHDSGNLGRYVDALTKAYDKSVTANAALEADNRALRKEIERHQKMEDMRFQVLPEPKNPTLWKYIDESHKHGVIDFHLRAARMADGGFKFYIHAAQASSSTEDFYIWPDPFSWHDMVANTKDIPEPDVEAFKKLLRKTLAPKEGK